MRAIFDFVTGRRTAWVTVAGCLVVLVLAITLLPKLANGTSQAGAGAAGDSLRVAQLLKDSPSANSSYALIVWSRRDGEILTSANRDSINARVLVLAKLSTDSSVRPQISVNRTAMLLNVNVNPAAANRDASAVVLQLRAAASHSLPSALEARFTGTVVAAANSQGAQSTVQLWVLTLAGLILAAITLAFTRRPLVWIAQLVVVGAASWLGTVVGLALCSALRIPVSTDAETVLATALLAASAGFCITVVVRRRREPSQSLDARATLAAALPAAAAIVAASAVVLAVALLALLLAQSPDARAIGISGAIGVVLSAVLVLLLLPALLAITGREVTRSATPQPAGPTVTANRPIRAGVVVGAILSLITLGLLAAQLATIATGLGGPSAQATLAQRVIDDAFGLGSGNQAIMLVPKSVGGATSITAPTTLAMAVPAVHSVTRNGSYEGRAELLVTVDADPGSPAAFATIDKLRRSFARTGGLTAQTLVGGSDAGTLDARNAAASDLGTVLPIAAVILLAILVAIVLAERRRRRTARPTAPN